jgi:hypothetical protein
VPSTGERLAIAVGDAVTVALGEAAGGSVGAAAVALVGSGVGAGGLTIGFTAAEENEAEHAATVMNTATTTGPKADRRIAPPAVRMVRPVDDCRRVSVTGVRSRDASGRLSID